MINYFSVFKEPEEGQQSPLSSPRVNGEELSVELIGNFQSLFGLLSELCERERSAPAHLVARQELLAGTDKGAEFGLCIGKIVRILKDESEWWASQSRLGSEDVIDVPCADAFIMCQGLRKLCLYAAEDSPRGCLPLIMMSIADLLRAVKIPSLLEHKSIHEPISRLLFLSARYEKFLGSVLALTTGLTTLEQSEYQRKVDLGMASLINVIWNKVTENPLILGFFSREAYSDEDEEKEEEKGEKANKSLEFDIISAIIPIMGSHHVGSMCKESFICALSMRNPLVDQYVASHTSVLQDCVLELTRKFYAALTAFTDSCRRADSHRDGSKERSMFMDAEEEGNDVSAFLPLLLSPLKTVPAAAAHNREEESRGEGGAEASENEINNDSDMLSQATSALSSYLFSTPKKGSAASERAAEECLGEEATSQPSSADKRPRSDKTEVMRALMRIFHFCDAVLVSVSDAPIGPGPSLRSLFALELTRAFLDSVFLPALRGRLTCIDVDEGDDHVASAAYLITRRVLKELSAANSTKAGILSLLLPFLSQALSTAGDTARVSLMDELLFRTVSPSSVVAASSSGVIATVVDALPLGDSFSLLLNQLVSSSAHASKEEPVLPIDEVRGGEGEDGDDEEEDRDALLDIQPLMHPLLLQLKGAGSCAERLRLMLPHLEHQDDGLAGDAGGVSTLADCVSRQVSKLAARIAYSCPSTESGADMATHDDLRGTLVDFLVAGVQSFRSRKFEEKIALSSLVERAVCVSLSVVVISGSLAPYSRGMESRALLAVVRLYIAIDAMCSQVTQAAQKCGAVSDGNMQAARLILSCGSASDGQLPGDINESSRTLLETAVLAAEMRQEVSAFFFAASHLMEDGAFVPHAILSASARKPLGQGREDSSDEEEEEEEEEEEDDPILPMELSVLSDIEAGTPGIARDKNVLENSTTQLSPALLKKRDQRGDGGPSSTPRRGEVEDTFMMELSELEEGLDSLVTAI